MPNQLRSVEIARGIVLNFPLGALARVGLGRAYVLQGDSANALSITVFAFGIGFVFILPRVRMLRTGLPEGNTPLSEAGRASVQDPVILTLIRVRFLLALGILYLMITKPGLTIVKA